MFGIPWIVFGIQHYMYADFVSTLVPAYMPWRLFWAYFTGTAMLAAGVAFVIRRHVQLAAFLLGCLLVLYLLMVHPLMLWNDPRGGQHWTRFMQDIAIMSATFALAGGYLGEETVGLSGWRRWLASRKASVMMRFGYALPFIGLGIQHFTHNAFVTAKVPDWAPFIQFWDYVIGLVLVVASYGMLFTSKSRWTASTLGVILTVLALLQHVPLLAANPHDAGGWTHGTLDIALAAGAFLIAWAAKPI
jgi:uncharacterized membrane protein